MVQKVTWCGVVTYTFIFVGCVSLVTSWTLGGIRQSELEGKDYRGELSAFYRVATCPNVNTSFGFSDGSNRLGFDGHTLRADAMAEGVACPVVPTESGALEIFVPPKDCEGQQFKAGEQYKPVVMLEYGAYASIALEVRDAAGAELLPATTLSLGPDEQFPWMIEGDTFPLGSAQATAACDVCDTSLDCGYSSDGVCDDGGPSSAHSLCPFGHDCADCGTRLCSEYPPSPPPPPPPTPSPPPPFGFAGRRLLFGGSRGLHSSRAAIAAHGGDEEFDNDAFDDDAEVVSHSPTSRRLLKGGWGGSSHGGRSGGVGSARWGSSSPSRVGSRSSTTTYRSSYGGVYGGRSVYYVGGRRYGGHSAAYYRGRGAIAAGATYFYVSRFRYSDRQRSSDCGATSTGSSRAGLDRYELDLPFSAPSEAGRYPLQAIVLNATIFVPRGTGVRSENADAWLSFYTSSGEWSEDSAAEDILSALGWAILVPSVLFCFCAPNRMRSEEGPRFSKSSSTVSQNPAAVQRRPTPQPMRGWSAGPAQVPVVQMNVPPRRSTEQQPTALPVATFAQPVAQPPMGIPMATYAAPQQVVAYPTAYPTTAVARPYPSNPPSPPGEERNKDE